MKILKVKDIVIIDGIDKAVVVSVFHNTDPKDNKVLVTYYKTGNQNWVNASRCIKIEYKKFDKEIK